MLQFFDSAIVESKKFAARLNQKIAQKRGLENEQSQAREDLVTRVDSQKIFLVELLQRKEAVQHQVDVLNNQEPLLNKMKQNISELESTSESSAYAKKELKKIEEEHTKLFTLKVTSAIKLNICNLFISDELIER
jgi:hypothetical protein